MDTYDTIRIEDNPPLVVLKERREDHFRIGVLAKYCDPNPLDHVPEVSEASMLLMGTTGTRLERIIYRQGK